MAGILVAPSYVYYDITPSAGFLLLFRVREKFQELNETLKYVELNSKNSKYGYGILTIKVFKIKERLYSKSLSSRGLQTLQSPASNYLSIFR